MLRILDLRQGVEGIAEIGLLGALEPIDILDRVVGVLDVMDVEEAIDIVPCNRRDTPPRRWPRRRGARGRGRGGVSYDLSIGIRHSGIQGARAETSAIPGCLLHVVRERAAEAGAYRRRYVPADLRRRSGRRRCGRSSSRSPRSRRGPGGRRHDFFLEGQVLEYIEALAIADLSKDRAGARSKRGGVREGKVRVEPAGRSGPQATPW